MTSEAKVIANHRYARLLTCPSTLFNHFTIIMQNKANLLYTQMNVNSVKTKDYENVRPFSRRENKANQTQFKPNQTQPVVSLSNLFQTQSNPTRSELVEPISKPIKPNL